jgi:RNA recognition motif-containing protein
MSTLVEKVSDAVNDVTAALGNTTLSDKPADSADKSSNAAHEAVLASAAEGRRLYIGNLAYATTEGELQSFFKGYLMYVIQPSYSRAAPNPFCAHATGTN